MKLALVAGSVLIVMGCSTGEPENVYRPTSTIKDIMSSMVEPPANEIWNSIAITVDLEGVHESFPTTDDEWNYVRTKAVTLAESSNLMLIPGRRVASADVKSENPEVELEPAQIQELIETDFDAWTAKAYELQDLATQTIASIDARDTAAFSETVNRLDRVCEGCHLDYWYPNDEFARQAYEESAPDYEAPEP